MVSRALAQLALVALYLGRAAAAPKVVPDVKPLASPTITLDQGTFRGVSDGSTHKFLGIPFAKPPIGDLRFRLPVANDPYKGSLDATEFGFACPNQDIDLGLPDGLAADAVDYVVNTLFDFAIPQSEDCLTVNVWKPANAKPDAKLPVVAWIYGGGFDIGSTNIYDGGNVVDRSIDLGEPVIYVSLNYRLSGFGFLASKEVKDAGVGNLGLQDQRLALRWIQKYVSAFGGDPTKVTIWGESAGAISVALHMLTNNGNPEGLFRAAFMNSGSPIPIGDITNGQKFYDDVVNRVGCTGAADTLDCLRKAPFDKLKAAMDASPGANGAQARHRHLFTGLALAWLPRVDGNFLVDNPQQLVMKGSVANVPFITGDCDDEGTLFALSSLDVTTEKELRDFLVKFYMPRATSADLDRLLALYPADITQGSPFDTGIWNDLTPQFKRISALLGDLVFQGPRRFFLQHQSSKQNTWSFLSKRLKDLPILGSTHATDLLNVYGPDDMTDYLVNFVNHLNPNDGYLTYWPKYDVANPQLLTFEDSWFWPLEVLPDTHRKDAIAFASTLAIANPF